MSRASSCLIFQFIFLLILYFFESSSNFSMHFFIVSFRMSNAAIFFLKIESFHFQIYFYSFGKKFFITKDNICPSPTAGSIKVNSSV